MNARSEALQPEVVGLLHRWQRRVTGLRRHEVADLAAVSVFWHTWLEQAPKMHAAPQGTDSRARALALDEASPRHLHRLAHVLVTEPAPIGNALDHGRVAFVQKSPSPACLIEPTSDPVAWSGAYARLSGGPERPSAECRYALVMMLTNHRPQEIMVSWKRQKHTICAF